MPQYNPSPWADGDAAEKASATTEEAAPRPDPETKVRVLDFNPFDDEETRYRIARDVADALNERVRMLCDIRQTTSGQISHLVLQALSMAVGGVVGHAHQGSGGYNPRLGSLIAASDVVRTGIDALTQASIYMTKAGCPEQPEVVEVKAMLSDAHDLIAAACGKINEELVRGGAE